MKEAWAGSFMFHRADSSRGDGMIINTFSDAFTTDVKFLIISQFKHPAIIYIPINYQRGIQSN